MRAILLAAGRGKRMGNLTHSQPKGLLPLHGKPLIEWQIQALQRADITDIAIVRGYQGHLFSYPVTYFDNPRWAQTNMLSTLLCAEDWLRLDTCVVSYTDIVYTAEAVQALKNAVGDIVVTFDANWLNLWRQRFTDPLSDAEIFQYQDTTLLAIGDKTTRLEDIQGQYMGLLKFTVTGWMMIRKILDGLSNEMIEKMDMTALLKLLLLNHYKISIAAIHSPWCEIDNVKDYQICQTIMNPGILE